MIITLSDINTNVKARIKLLSKTQRGAADYIKKIIVIVVPIITRIIKELLGQKKARNP